MNIKVGLLFSLTGTTALTERGQCDAAKFAIEAYNEGNHKVEALVRDICSDPAKSAEEAEALAKAGVKIFIGCYTSACRKAVLPILEKYDCLLVYPTLYEGRECHSNVFYTGEVPNQQIHTLLDYVTHRFGKRIYCVGTDYIYPRETNQQVKTYVNERNGSIIGEQYVPFGHQNFYDILEDIHVKRPDAIFLTLVGQSIIPFYRTYRRMKLQPEKIPIFSPITKETEIAAMGAEFGAGHYSSASYFQSLHNPYNTSFVNELHRYIGSNQVISSVMFNTYLGTKMIIESIIETKSLDHRMLFYHLSGQKLETACGTLLVEEDHRHLSRPVKIGKALPNGQFEIVWDSQRNIPPKPFKEKSKAPEHLNEITLEAWGQISEEALLVMSEDNHVLYLTKKAEELTHLQEGQALTPEMIQGLHDSFEINHYGAKHQRILLLRPKITTRPSGSFYCFDRIRTRNYEYELELEVAKLASQSSANVLILGETGTGKEVVAQSIHNQSERRNGPFIAVNTALLPRELIASELFGFTDGAFRADLFYRLNVLSITIPPLSARPEDIEHLCQEFLNEFHHSHGEGPNKISGEALQLFIQYHWPGNIRELRNVLERAFLLCGREKSHIQVKHLPRALKGHYQRKSTHTESLKEMERKMLEQALRQTETITDASKALGIARSTLYRKLKEFHITR